MKIWIVSVGEPIPSDGENVRLRRMGNFAMYASKNNIDVVWFTVSFEHYNKIQRCENDIIYKINDNFRINISYVSGYKKNISYSRIKHHKQAADRIFYQMSKSEKPDIIIGSMEPLEVSNSLVRYASINKIPNVIDIRDLWPEIYYDVIPKFLYPVLNIYVKSCKKSLEYTLGNCTSIIGLSKGFLQYGLKYARRRKSDLDTVIPIAYPNYDYCKVKGLFRKFWEKYNISEQDFIITFVGNFGDQFKFNDIIDVANKLKNYTDIKFVLCGKGVQEENVKARTYENVIFPGWIEKEEILTLLSKSSLGLAPYIDSMNYRLNTPNKFGEYLSAGLPILVSVCGEMPELLEDYECGFYFGNAQDLEKLIMMYYKNEKLLEYHSQNARALFENKFNGDKINKMILEHLIRVKKRSE